MPKALFTTPAEAGRDPALQFSEIQHEPGAIWLDSAAQMNGWGSRSFLAHQPTGELKLLGRQMSVRVGNRTSTELASVWDALLELDNLTEASHTYAIGFISYEAALPLLGLEPRVEPSLPLLHFYLYDSDQVADRATPATAVSPAELVRTAASLCQTISRNEYAERIRRIKRHIHEGNIYQANFTCRFDVRSDQTPFAVYGNLRSLNPASYAAYLNFGDYQILSTSPERLFYRDGDFLTTSPIKGTIHRGRSPREDQQNIQELLASEKDRAEHLMIVDLERNDLGKIARTGSVTVDNLFRPELHSSVIHLVSDISARIDNDLPTSGILSALLPGGSITGAPKRRAVEIINDVEAVPRSVYTGCIGYIHGRHADFNLAIRTIIHHHDMYHVHAGGGIVADSEPPLEYQEMLLKASNLFRALGISGKEQQCLLR